MAGKFSDLGSQYFLGTVCSNTTKETEWTLHLYTDDITPTDSSTEGSFTEATGGGYSEQTIDVDESFIDSVTISTSSAANPTQINATSHGLTTGDYITIANHSGASSNINGTHQVTVVDADNFTIPVDLSGGGGTGGTLSRGMQISSVSGIYQAAANEIPFVFSGALTGSLSVRGYYLMAGTIYLGGEKFSDTYTPTTDGDILRVTPTLKMSYGTAQ